MEGKNLVDGNIYTEGGKVRIGDNYFLIKIYTDTNSVSNNYKHLLNQTRTVFKKIRSNIANVTLDRSLTDRTIKDLFSENQYIFIKGVAGSGKSVYSKQILEGLEDTCIFSFSADQFLTSSLTETLTKIDVQDIIEAFNSFEEYPNKLIYIDSFEKLQEGEGEAFRELMVILRDNPNIKVVLSCRDYAIENLQFDYFEPNEDIHTSINVPMLSDVEIKYFVDKIPSLKPISLNNNLNEVLRIPKYLNFAYKLTANYNENVSEITEVEFKKSLWKHFVEGTIVQNGINITRGLTFIDIAVKRAKELSLATNTDEFNSGAITLLVSEGILYQDKNNNHCAPSHDILEDWALIRYISKIKDKSIQVNSFFDELGEEPAIRRGFRLWIESKIEEEEEWIYEYIYDTLNDDKIDNHWKDEVLTAIIKSKIFGKYLEENEQRIKSNKHYLLKQILRLLRISCKDSKQIPNNSGWDSTIKFIHDNQDVIDDLRIPIINLLSDWDIILMKFDKIPNADTAKYSGTLACVILENYNSETIKMETLIGGNSLMDKVIQLVYNAAEYIPNKVREILQKLIENKDTDDYLLRKKRDKQIEYALSYFYTGTLPKLFPNELVKLANNLWRDKEVNLPEIPSYLTHRRDSVEKAFGLSHKCEHNYFPPSAYRTFTLALLWSNHKEGLDFIINFTNHCATAYSESSFLKEDRFIIEKDDFLKLELNYDGNKREIMGSEYLWSINRGGGTAVPYLLQSIVCALEKYLYDFGSLKMLGEDNIANRFEYFFSRIYKESNSVILISALSSIAMAYPKAVKSNILPLLSSAKILRWDFQRWFKDRGKYMSGFTNTNAENKLCSEERLESSKLEFRTKHTRGLSGFFLDYQFNIAIENKAIYQSLDKLNMELNPSDINTKKILSEMDRRTWKSNPERIEKEGTTIIEIQPSYDHDKDLRLEVQRNQEQSKLQNEYSSFSLWVSNNYLKESNEPPKYLDWKKTYEYCQNYDRSKIDMIMAFPIGTLAVLGLEVFSNELNQKEFDFCSNLILELAQKFYSQGRQQYNPLDVDMSISIYDSQSIYSYLPKMLSLNSKLQTEQINELNAIIFYFLRDLQVGRDTNLKYFYHSYKENLWKIDFDLAYKYFVGILYYAKFNKKFQRRYNNTIDEEERSKIEKEEEEILALMKNTKETKLSSFSISYETFSHWDLNKALSIFPSDKYHFSFDFIDNILKAHFASFEKDDNRFDAENYYEIGANIKETTISYLLENKVSETSISIFNNIIKNDLQVNSKWMRRDLVEYKQTLIQEIYCYLDSHSTDIDMLDRFWKFWNILSDKIISGEANFLKKEYLFYLGFWKSDADDCFMLSKNERTYLNNLDKIESLPLEPLFQLLSGIGFKKLTPAGLKVLKKQLDNKNELITLRGISYLEKLIMRCFRLKAKELKENKIVLRDFFDILNYLIELSSYKAYYVRESLILYKKKH